MAKPDFHPPHHKPSKRDLSTVKMRRCLECDLDFLSDGPHCRICPTCTGLINARPTPERTYTVYARDGL
jgi:hypothetical protein